ncbi:MAG: hypothetical protein B5M54_04120 [Candidatus Aminicenantes bacterium 4484_214]|nr:MAG: hypothetical protein B5M54_04120 [Candidatus Aminicenantes bacterium 4484_214]
MNDFLLEVSNLNKAFGDLQAVKEVSFKLHRQSLTILAGPDGSGKSTILKLILGLLAKDSGEIKLNGQPLQNNDYRALRSIAAYMPEQFSLYPDLTVEENLNFFADIQGLPHQRREELKQHLLAKTGMLPFRQRRAANLSGGMKQKLALSAALLSSPQLLLLDEPTTGVDPLSRIEFFQIIQELKEEGTTILAATPYLEEAETGDEIIFLHQGEAILQEAIKKLKEEFPVRLYRLSPQGDVFSAFQRLSAGKLPGDEIYIRGNSLLLLRPSQEPLLSPPEGFLEITPEIPRLEDIYIYYERKHHAR